MKQKNRAVMLTTTDNPYNPFKNFDEWYMYDLEKGYNSCSYLARIAEISDEMSEEEVLLETETEIEEKKDIERAIDEIIKYDFMKVRKKIYSDEEK